MGVFAGHEGAFNSILTLCFTSADIVKETMGKAISVGEADNLLCPVSRLDGVVFVARPLVR